MITKDGKPVYKKAFGKSNLELNTDLNPESVFQLGSITKQFTAIAILILEEQGKLKVTDQYPNMYRTTLPVIKSQFIIC